VLHDVDHSPSSIIKAFLMHEYHPSIARPQCSLPSRNLPRPSQPWHLLSPISTPPPLSATVLLIFLLTHFRLATTCSGPLDNNSCGSGRTVADAVDRQLGSRSSSGQSRLSSA
jgi:hypothetical protein